MKNTKGEKGMRYKCLVFDHDDTVVESTAQIHWPCFCAFLNRYFPGKSISLEDYFLKNFAPGFIEMCREDFGLTDADLDTELKFWQAYVKNHTPRAYAGIRQIMERQKSEGGLLAVISHSFDYNIRRDYEANHLPVPDMVFGWEQPRERRKPNAWPLEQVLEHFSLSPGEVLVVDDLKPGYDMAKALGVPFAAAGWANNIPEIESFMRRNSDYYCKTVDDLAGFLTLVD